MFVVYFDHSYDNNTLFYSLQLKQNYDDMFFKQEGKCTFNVGLYDTYLIIYEHRTVGKTAVLILLFCNSCSK